MNADGPVLVNGLRLPQSPEDSLPVLRERAWAELLRQEAVRQGILPDLSDPTTQGQAPDLTDDERRTIEDMLDRLVVTPTPDAQDCARYYDAHRSHYTHGQQVRLRHILFAVTDRVPVQALAQRAETALMELREGRSGRSFEMLCRELSNCPSAAQGGDLGWIGPADCVPELTQALFGEEAMAPGLHPRLVHSRFGLHIVELLERRAGVLATMEQVRERIADELALQSRATALRQFMLILVGNARIEGLELEGAQSPLVQ